MSMGATAPLHLGIELKRPHLLDCWMQQPQVEACANSIAYTSNMGLFYTLDRTTSKPWSSVVRRTDLL
jgi:hypothetical protein